MTKIATPWNKTKQLTRTIAATASSVLETMIFVSSGIYLERTGAAAFKPFNM